MGFLERMAGASGLDVKAAAATNPMAAFGAITDSFRQIAEALARIEAHGAACEELLRQLVERGP